MRKLFEWFKPKKVETRDSVLEWLEGYGNQQRITKPMAMSVPAVATAVNFISGTIAGLSVNLKDITKNDGKNIADSRLHLLNLDTGDTLDAYQFKRAIITDLLLTGNAYAYVKKKGNKIVSLHYVDSDYVSIVMGGDVVEKTYKIYINGKEYRDFDVMKLTINSRDGIIGKGFIGSNQTLLATMLNAMKYENNSISSGTKRGFLKSKYKLDKQKMDELKVAWRNMAESEDNNVLVLNDGISFEPSSTTATENQLNDSKRTNTSLVYSYFGLSDTLLNGGNAETYINNIKTGLLPIINAFTTALNNAMLLESEKTHLRFSFDLSELFKTTLSERYQAYTSGLSAGWLQIDDVRTMESLPPLGMDFVKMSLGDVFYYPNTKEIFTPNTGTTLKGGEINNGNRKEGE